MPLSAQCMIAAPAGPARSLLIADPSASMRLQMRHWCQASGIEAVHEAEGGAQALALLARLPELPHLMVLELQMPSMDGVELLSQLHLRGWHIPVLIVSNQPPSLVHAVEQMALDLGMPVIGALTKPLQPAAWSQALIRYQAVLHATVPSTPPRAPAPIRSRDLRDALQARQIHAHYQPKVDIQTGKVHGVEALARWQHPQFGAIPPDQFIALAERDGLIHELTLQILAQSLAQLALWRQHGLQLTLAVNFSPLLLQEPRIMQEIQHLVEHYRIPATQVVLEITESAGVARLGEAISVLARLRLKGFGLSIDDYGTGFSSMQHLARLPFTELKIDRSFVHGAHEQRHLSVILQSALDMARRLELVTVAEGIETPQDWDLLRRYGCTVGQGYLISRPMPPDAFLEWLQDQAQSTEAAPGSSLPIAS